LSCLCLHKYLDFPFLWVLGIFFSATLSAMGIFKIYNQPFVNPSLTKEQIGTRVMDIGKTLAIILSQAIVVTAFLWNDLLPMSAHSLPHSFVTIIVFGILIEFFYYIYHRIVHKHFYLEIHQQHHLNTDVYPLDTFDFTLFDSMGLVISIGLPLLLLEVTMLEQFIILFIYIVSSYLSHSRLFYDHHYKHHSLRKCNYCIFFPIFDILFGTYK
jgi:sterol desaturase/sphingolipid hydroxylase (fatty acid hydroxylase superfamily)